MKYGFGGSNNNQNLDLRVFILPPLSSLPNQTPDKVAVKKRTIPGGHAFGEAEEEEDFTAENS